MQRAGKTVDLRYGRQDADLESCRSRRSAGIECFGLQQPYELTAETVEPCQITFVKREEFLRFLKEHNEACLRVAEQLSEKYDTVCRNIRSLVLSHSAARKACESATGMDGKRRRELQNGNTHEALPDPRGTCPDDRHLA